MGLVFSHFFSLEKYFANIVRKMNAPGSSQQIGDNVAAQNRPHHGVHSSTSLPSIELLVGRENWSTWKFAVQTFLELEDLWEAVKPTPNADGTDPAVDPLKDRRARGKIILLLDPVNYVHVREAKTAKETWSKLEAAFEDTGLTRKVGLLRKLITAGVPSNQRIHGNVCEHDHSNRSSVAWDRVRHQRRMDWHSSTGRLARRISADDNGTGEFRNSNYR